MTVLMDFQFRVGRRAGASNLSFVPIGLLEQPGEEAHGLRSARLTCVTALLPPGSVLSARPNPVPWLLDEAFLRVRIVRPSMIRSWSQVMPSTRTEADRAGCGLYARASCMDLVSFGILHLRSGFGGRLLAGGAAGSDRARSSRGAGPLLRREVLAADGGQGHHARHQRDDRRNQQDAVQACGEGGAGDHSHGLPGGPG